MLNGPASAKGSLVIVGGGLSADNDAVYNAFIDRAKGGQIAVIVSASGEPHASFDAIAANLERYGVDRSRISLIALAEIDDPSTSLDEAGWSVNADKPQEIAKINQANAIWFTGGDQARTARLLLRKGRDTLMLAAIRKRLRAGAVIGGTSAGAAIMGTGMIVCGDPKHAHEPLGRSFDDCAATNGKPEPLVLGKGLGFLRGYVVDQHFGQRSRLPRLLRAMACGAGWGIGIDEDTAVVVDLAKRTASVLGRGRVVTIEHPRPRIDCAFNLGLTDVVFHESGQPVDLQR